MSRTLFAALLKELASPETGMVTFSMWISPMAKYRLAMISATLSLVGAFLADPVSFLGRPGPIVESEGSDMRV